jgi:acyl carrier protein
MTDIIAKLADIWSETLAVDSVATDDDFFALGGDSVAAMTVMLRIEEDFGVYLDPAAIFEHRTLGTLAFQIAAAAGPSISAPSGSDAVIV